MLRRLLFLLLLVFASGSAFAATQGGPIPVPLPLFPQNNWWNLDISNAPVDTNSASYITFIGATKGLHPDFGGDAGGGYVYGMPFIQVNGAQQKKTIDFVETPDESDGWNPDTGLSFPFYPVPDEPITMNGWIESGLPGNVDDRDDSDRHMLIVDTTNNYLYELYDVYYNGTQWEAGSGAFFDMNTNGRRPDGWTSADAAGLAILPGLVRYDEVFGGDSEIRHAFRFTVRDTNGYVWPASHNAGSNASALPMGARLRLKADKNISSFPPELQKIFRAFKKYGLIVADNGSDMYISGTYDTRWDNDVLNPAFAALKASDFEVVQLGWKPNITFTLSLPQTVGAGDATSATLTAYDANYNVATGYTGTVQFTSTDGSAVLPGSYTFTGGDAGVHTFTNGFTLLTPGSQSVTVRDAATVTYTTTVGVTVGPATPTLLDAHATTTTQVQLSWSASSGATQYEIARAATPNAFTTVGTTASTNYTDNTALANTSYVYKVRALDASARTSPYSTPDLATTILFTGGTTVQLVHITQLRQAVNSVRTAAGLTASTFTDPSLTTATRVKAVHITELRSALGAARAALGVGALSLTDPALAGGAVVKSAHVVELRAGAN
ncbi:MAG TPA: fibronectin type III domain-containing protein [Thermoanaerobaculia bacterium]|nr:fibronectin type III domain-containing protein [Thermoanaerobaculia bacterium]